MADAKPIGGEVVRKPRVLLLDNDPKFNEDTEKLLREINCDPKNVRTVTEAEKEIRDGSYNLLILDVMIPTMNAEEEGRYPASETDQGRSTGVAFYVKHKSALDGKGIKVLALSQRLDKKLADDFLAAGLPQNCFATKLDLRDPDVFVRRVKELLASKLNK